MKRVIILILCAALSINLCGCGKGKQVEAAEAAIEAIGDVTLESGEVIEAARTAYDALKPRQQEKVENYAVLTDAEAVFRTESAIDAIGEVTIDSGDAIEEARNAYDALTPEQREAVISFDILTTAEEEFELAELYEKNRITQFNTVRYSVPSFDKLSELFNGAAVDELYNSDNDVWSAYFYLNFLLAIAETVEIDGIIDVVYIVKSDDESHIDFYSQYSEHILCIRWWLEEGSIEYGTAETSLSLDEYIQMLERAGAIHEYHQIDSYGYQLALTYIVNSR